MRRQEWWEVSEKVANREVHENNSRLQQDQKVDFMNVLFNTHRRVFFGASFVFFWQQTSNLDCTGSYELWKAELESHCPRQSVRKQRDFNYWIFSADKMRRGIESKGDIWIADLWLLVVTQVIF